MFDNREQLIGVSVQGNIVSPEYPALPASPYVIGADGRPQLLPSQGGIVYNVHVGDSAFGWLADLVQPGVSIRASTDPANQALNVLSCLGNEAIVVSGQATGARGTVIGKSGRFAEHVIVHLAPETLEQLAIEDKVLVRAYGRSLALADYTDVQLKSISPQLLDALEVEPDAPGALTVPVAAEVPAVSRRRRLRPDAGERLHPDPDRPQGGARASTASMSSGSATSSRCATTTAAGATATSRTRSASASSCTATAPAPGTGRA